MVFSSGVGSLVECLLVSVCIFSWCTGDEMRIGNGKWFSQQNGVRVFV